MITKPIHPCTQYALDVVEGRRITGHSEYLACKRHLDDLKRQDSKDFPWVFDEEKANKIYSWFLFCRHVEGRLAGQPIELKPFQQFILGCIFGWVNKTTRMRRFTKAYIQVARKNGKSTLLGGTANYLMVGDGEQSPRVYCAAVDREQARIVYEIAKTMAEHSPDICKRLKIRNYKISHITRGGVLMPLSKETKNKDGLNPSGAIIDEYHAHPTSEIHDLLWSARGQRAQMIMIIITTAGMDALNSPCFKEYNICKKILNRQITNSSSERYFVMICELDENDDEHDPKNWIKANPLLAEDPEGMMELTEQHDFAFDTKDPVKIRDFRIKRLNKWVYDDDKGYMGELMDLWDELAVIPPDQNPTPEELREAFGQLTEGLPCNFGIDLSKSIDLTADGFVFPLEDGRVAVCAHGFLPEGGVVRHEKTDLIPYRDYAKDGWITSTEGEVTDFHALKHHMIECEELNSWAINEIDYDPYNATYLATELTAEGRQCIQVRQGVQTLSEPTKLFRDLVASKKLVHDGSPVLKWCVGNAKVKIDSNGNIKLTKETANDTERIDLLAAIINALSGLPRLKEAAGNDLTDSVLDENWGM